MGRFIEFALVNIGPALILYTILRRRDLATTPEGKARWFRCLHCVSVREVGPGVRLMVPWRAGFREWLPLILALVLLPRAVRGWPGSAFLVLAWALHLITRKRVTALKCPNCGSTNTREATPEEFERHLTMNSHK
ncbi:MAG: hypothetical protein AB7F75_06450 [Planctomycetota bacterium]